MYTCILVESVEGNTREQYQEWCRELASSVNWQALKLASSELSPNRSGQ